MPADVVVTVAGLVLTVTVPATYAGSQFTFDYTVTDPSGLTATAARDDRRDRHPTDDDHHHDDHDNDDNDDDAPRNDRSAQNPTRPVRVGDQTCNAPA